VKEFPTMSFKSTKVTFTGDLPSAVGDLVSLNIGFEGDKE
jgi:polyisoprenoid-binding protein YceI